MPVPSDQTLIDNTLTALNGNVTAGIREHETNDRRVQRFSPIQELEVLRILEARKQRSRRRFSKIVLCGAD